MQDGSQQEIVLFSLHSEACDPSPHLLHTVKVLFWTPNYSFSLKSKLSASQLLCLQITSVLRTGLIPFTEREWSHRQRFGCLLWATQDLIVLFNMACCSISFVTRTAFTECNCRSEHFTFNLTEQASRKWDVRLTTSCEKSAYNDLVILKYTYTCLYNQRHIWFSKEEFSSLD